MEWGHPAHWHCLAMDDNGTGIGIRDLGPSVAASIILTFNLSNSISLSLCLSMLLLLCLIRRTCELSLSPSQWNWALPLLFPQTRRLTGKGEKTLKWPFKLSLSLSPMEWETVWVLIYWSSNYIGHSVIIFPLNKFTFLNLLRTFPISHSTVSFSCSSTSWAALISLVRFLYFDTSTQPLPSSLKVRILKALLYNKEEALFLIEKQYKSLKSNSSVW